MELYARIMELNSYFVVRLRKDDYKKERSRITSTDSPININLIGERLKKFHDPILKEKYSKELHLNLRIVYVELPSGETEALLTNLPQEIMTTEDICQIYDYRWGIETQYNTFKNRLDIENYSGTKRITIEQDIYSKFLFYNIFCQYNCYLNMLVNHHMRKKGKCDENTEYQIDQANLIRNFNDELMKVVINPTKRNIQQFTSYIIWESTDEPNKIKKNRNYEHVKSKPFNRYRLNYQAMSWQEETTMKKIIKTKKSWKISKVYGIAKYSLCSFINGDKEIITKVFFLDNDKFTSLDPNDDGSSVKATMAGIDGIFFEDKYGDQTPTFEYLKDGKIVEVNAPDNETIESVIK